VTYKTHRSIVDMADMSNQLRVQVPTVVERSMMLQTDRQILTN